MLKLIAGIGKPTSGTVRVDGRVSALIELGAGFHPEISGRENVYINGMMLGLSRREIARRFDEIVAFAELQEFIDAPVKTYSSGMYMRLGFAVAINVDPDVLLVDEVLAVGDEAFTHKCLDKFADFRRRGKTVLIVTHSLDLVERFCDEALWLDRGRVRDQGDPKRVIDAYLLDVAAAEERQLADAEIVATAAVARPPTSADVTPRAAEPPVDEPPDMSKAAEGRWGSREAEITHVELRRADGAAAHLFTSGDPLAIRMHVRAHAPLRDVVFGIGIFNAEGICCYGTNTLIEGVRPGELAGEAAVEFSIPSLQLVAGTYKVDVAVHRENGAPFDYHRQLYAFRVTAPTKDAGIYRPPHRWTFSGGIRVTP
jgi:ABC-type polysaccharide/polyol phosphate transport system ATPase subunit